MLRKGLLPIWVGILVLSGMFLLGQDTWPPQESPQIVSVLPDPGQAGAPVTVTGTLFGSLQGTSLLLYDGDELGITSWSATEIQAVLPDPKAPGTYLVQVVLETAVSNLVPHTIVVPQECVVDADCDDENVCTGAETCLSGTCLPGIPLVCDDGNICTGDTCDPALGCVYGCSATGPTDPCCADPACVGSPACLVPGDMAQMPAGCFMMGDPFNEGGSNELPVHNVCISAFEMDVYEVTNATYAECVAGGGCTVPASSSSSTRPSYYGDPAYDDFPVMWVDWFQANAYCAWAGKRLPTEAEWEYAARGRLAGKRYPWGDTISGTDANYRDSGDPWDNDTSPVGHYAPNGYGLYDMAGNVWEWTSDWYGSSYYQYCVDNGIVNDPPGPASGTARVLRGGSWNDPTYYLRAAERRNPYPDVEYFDIGFRCAR